MVALVARPGARDIGANTQVVAGATSWRVKEDVAETIRLLKAGTAPGWLQAEELV
jgi:hypothetical protein